MNHLLMDIILTNGMLIIVGTLSCNGLPLYNSLFCGHSIEYLADVSYKQLHAVLLRHTL
jgi:hypothetical protein